MKHEGLFFYADKKYSRLKKKGFNVSHFDLHFEMGVFFMIQYLPNILYKPFFKDRRVVFFYADAFQTYDTVSVRGRNDTYEYTYSTYFRIYIYLYTFVSMVSMVRW